MRGFEERVRGHETRSEADRIKALERTVQRFFEDFANARFEEARLRTARDFLWFGKAITEAEWKGEKLAAYVAASALEANNAREVPDAIIRTWLADRVVRLFDGALEDDDAVVLIDIRRHGETSTSGVVVGTDAVRGNVVRRVFDPHELSVALASIA